MKGILIVLFFLLFLIPTGVGALEPTSPGLRGNQKDGASTVLAPSLEFEKSLTIHFWYQGPTGSVGLVDAITGAVEWQALKPFRVSGSQDSLFPCRFTFRCSIGNRIIKYCNVMTDNRESYRMNIDLEGLLHVSVDGAGRQSVSFDAEGVKKRIHVYGRTKDGEAWCGIEP
jgi:hypothetical protein